MRYHRIILKLSGEALAGEHGYGIDSSVVSKIVDQIELIYSLGVEIGLVIGGGNIFRGVMGANKGMDRVRADYMGMIATIINAIALHDELERRNISSRVMSGIDVPVIAERYISSKAKRHIEKGRIVIFSGGTGNPYFSTDTAAALRASEINADIVMKATNVNGVYDSDPKLNPMAKKYTTISFQEVLEKNLKVMDATAISLCKENNLPILVFNMFESDCLLAAVNGDLIGTLVS